MPAKVLPALVAAWLCFSLPLLGATKAGLQRSVDQATLERPVLVFFSVKNECDLCPGYIHDVLRHPDFMRLLGQYRTTWSYIVFDNAPYLDPKATLPPNLRAELELAQQFGLDVSKKGATNPRDFPSLFLATGAGKLTRLKINLDHPNGELRQLMDQISAALLPFPEAPLAALPASGMIVAYGSNLAYAWDGTTTTPPQIFANGNPAAKTTDPGIAALAIGHHGQQFFAVTRGRTGLPTPLMRGEKVGVQILYTPPAPGGDVDPFINDIKLDDEDNVYISQTRKGVGKILRLVHQGAETTWTVEPFYVDRAADLPDWTGNFAFGRLENGATDLNMLYLISQRSLYRIGRKNGVWLNPQKINFPNAVPVDAILVTKPNEAIVCSGQQLLQLQGWSNWRVVLKLPAVLRNVFVAP